MDKDGLVEEMCICIVKATSWKTGRKKAWCMSCVLNEGKTVVIGKEFIKEHIVAHALRISEGF
jgi:hypothetical protein